LTDKPISIGLDQDSEPEEVVTDKFTPAQSNLDSVIEFREAQTRQAVSVGVEKNPDQEAKVVSLSEQTGLPPDTVERQLSDVEKRQKTLDLLAQDYGRRAPSLRNKLADPSFVGMTHDDMENLVRTEEVMRNNDMGYLEKIGANYKKNRALVESSEIGVARWQAQLGIGDEVSERQLLRLENLEKDTGFTHETGFFAGIPVESVGMLPMVFDVLAEGGIAGTGGAALGGAIGFAATRTPAGATAGAKFGGGLAFKMGAFHSVFNIESGLAYNDYVQTDGIDRDMAAKASIVVGAINGSLEFFSLSLIGRTVTPALRSVIRSRVRRMMATETGRQVIQRIAGRYLAAAGGEGLTEGMQEVSTMAGEVFAGMFKEGEEVTEENLNTAFDEMQGALPEIIKSDEVKGAALVGLQAGLGLSFPGSVASSVSQTRGKKTKTNVEQGRIDKIVELSTDAKLRPRSGKVYRQTIEEIAEEIEATTGEVNEIYWTASEALKWLEAEEIDINEPPPSAGVASILEQLSDALATDGDIVLSIADFATDIAPSENFAETVRAHVKMSDDAFTQGELKDVDATVEKRIKKLIDDAKISVETQRQVELIAAQVTEQLIDTNKLDKESAKTSASLISNYVLTKAARTGMSVEDVFAKMGIEIVGPEHAPLEGDAILDQVIEANRMAEVQLARLDEEGARLDQESEIIGAQIGQFDNFVEMLSRNLGIDFREATDTDLEGNFFEALSQETLPKGSNFDFGPAGVAVFPFQDIEGTQATPSGLTQQVRGLQEANQANIDRQAEIEARREEIGQQRSQIDTGARFFNQGPVDETGDLFAKMEEEIDFAPIEEGESAVEVKADINRLSKMLGPQLYGNMSDMPRVTIKELVQNSFDAIKDLIGTENEVDDPIIQVTTDPSERTITVEDNGIGMTPDIIRDAFLTIAGTHKESDRPSGSFGVAKMLFLFGADRIQLTTVRDGFRTTMDTTGEELLNSSSEGGTQPTIKTERTDQPSGTTIVVTIPASYNDTSTGEQRNIFSPSGYMVEEVLQHSPLLEDVQVISNGQSLDIGSEFPIENYAPLATVRFDWGEIDVLISKDEQPGATAGKNMHILSNGLWQFSSALKENPFAFMGPNVPRVVYINVKPAGTPAQPGYPFVLNRQAMTTDAGNDLAKIQNFMSAIFGADQTEELAKGFGVIRQIDAEGNLTEEKNLTPDTSTIVRPTFNFDPGDVIEVKEGVLTRNGEVIEPIDQDGFEAARIDVSAFRVDEGVVDPNLPIIHNAVVREGDGKALLDVLFEEFGEQRVVAYFAKFTTIFTSLRDTLNEKGRTDFDGVDKFPVGTFFDKAGGNFTENNPGAVFGINIRVPFDGMFINPAQSSIDPQINPDSKETVFDSQRHRAEIIAANMITTMIHEMAHFSEMNHELSFINALQSAMATLTIEADLQTVTSQLGRHIGENLDIFNSANEKLYSRDYRNPGAALEDSGTAASQDARGDTGGDTAVGERGEQTGVSGPDAESTGVAGSEQVDEGFSEGVGKSKAVNSAPGSVHPEAGNGSQLNQIFNQDTSDTEFSEEILTAHGRVVKAAEKLDSHFSEGPEGSTVSSGVAGPQKAAVTRAQNALSKAIREQFPDATPQENVNIRTALAEGETVLKQDTRGEILFDNEAETAIIRLTEAADLSTFLHESGHLFLEMEKRFFNDPSISDSAKADSQAILDWLGVDSFEDIETKHHEKFARGFEAYLYEGKAPSAELRGAFRRFSAWLQKIYQGLRQLNVQLSPEIIGVFDRMLATDEQIAEVKEQMALEPLFKTAEEADMTPEEFVEYQEKSQGRAEEELRKKVLAQLTRTATKWWREELAKVQDEVREELSALELYRAIAFLRAADPPEGFEENKMDRDTVYQMLGLASPTEVRRDPKAVHPDVDSLSVAIAKLGGLDREEAELQGVDPAHWRNIKVLKTDKKTGQKVLRSVPNPENMPAGVTKRLFKAEGGRTFDEMRELLAEQGMDYLDEDTTASDLLEKLLEDLSGDTQYSKQANFDLLFENPNEVPKERFKAPAQLRGLTKKGGISPSSVAEIFGFASGYELVTQIMESPTLNFAVERKSNEVMVQRHGDILNDGTLEREAIEASHNTEQGSALLAELRALSGQTNIQAISERKAIKDAAERIIGGKRISTLRPAQYHAAEVKAAKAAQEAMDTGDLEAAQAAKQKQVFNFYLWRAATEARTKADKMQKRLRTMQTKNYPASAVRADYAGQLKQFLAAYDFRRSNSQARHNGQQLLDSVKKWIRDQQEDPKSPANIIDADQLTTIIHYRDMTLDQLQAVHDVANSLLNAGRKNSKAEKEQFNANMKIMAEHIAEVAAKKKDLGIEDTKARRKTQWSRAVFAYHRKLESFVRELDAFEELGPFWKLIIKPLLDANNKKLKMQEAAHDSLDAIFEGHDGLFNENKDKRSFTLESGRKIQLSLGGRIAMLLNWGNEGSRAATLNQHDLVLTNKDVETILATLSDTDLDLAQDIWDYIDTYWPEIAKQERDLTGVVPVKVEASEFTVNGRKMKGGYYPLVEDIARGRFVESDAQREARQAREKIGGTTRAMTAHGWTNERRNFAGKSIDLNIDVVFSHVEAVIHDLSHRQAVMDVDRVLSNKDIADAIKNSLGREAHQSMKNTVAEVAGGQVNTRELSQVQATLRWSRLAITYGALGFSLKTGFSQMLGFATAVGEFGGREVVVRGVIDYMSNPVENRAFIEANSVFMRERGKTMHRDVTDILQGLKGSTTMNTLRKKAFLFLLSGDRAISLPVWWGQYQVGMDRVADPAFEGFVTEQDAIDWADRSVSRTQQSGLLMDLANIESKNEFIKMWTVMYSAFSAIYQIAVEQGKKAQLGKINRIEYVYNMMWILVIPPLFEELMTGREDDDDEDSNIVNNRWTKSVAGFSLGTMAGLREIGWLMEAGMNSELPMQRVLKTPFDLGTQIAQFEIDAAFIRAAFAVPQLFHIPGGSQLTRTMQYLLALEEGDEEGFNAWEFLVTGPREESDEARRKREDSQ